MAKDLDNIRTDADFVNTVTLGALGGAVENSAVVAKKLVVR